AAPVATSLDWTRGAGAEACISEQELRTAVETRLGRELVDASKARLRIEGSISRTHGAKGWTATLIVSDASGTLGNRELQEAASSCAELNPEIVLAVVLAIDPDAASTSSQPDLDPGPTPAQPPLTMTVGPAPRARSAETDRPAANLRARSWRFGVNAG